MTTASRIAVRHAGDDTEFYAERDRREVERREALAERIAATDPSILADVKAIMRRR